jgi:hypothetical protein
MRAREALPKLPPSEMLENRNTERNGRGEGCPSRLPGLVGGLSQPQGLADISRHVIGYRLDHEMTAGNGCRCPGGQHLLVSSGTYCSPQHSMPFKLRIGSGNEVMVSNPVRPIRSIRFENPTDPLADSPSGSQSLSK